MRSIAVVALLAVAGCGSRTAIEIENAWARATPPGSTVAAAYAHVTAARADEILSVATPAADRVEMHASAETDGVMQMRPVATVTLPANKAVKFEAGGLHLMLIGLHAPLLAGSSFPITFVFRSAAPVTIQANVVAPGDEHAAH